MTAALYHQERCTHTCASLTEAFAKLRSHPDSMAWIGLQRPHPDELPSLTAGFDLHPLAMEDALETHQRHKLERYDHTLFVVLRAVRYLDAAEEVEFAELRVFVGTDFVITVRHGATPDLVAVRRRIKVTPELLAHGPQAVLCCPSGAAVDGYVPVVAGVRNDIKEIEAEVFANAPEVSRRTYELSHEVMDFQRATRSLDGILDGLTARFEKHDIDEELRFYLRDVADHVTNVADSIYGYCHALQDILTVNATLVSRQRQNEEMRTLAPAGHSQNKEIEKISTSAAILFAPTLIGPLYGENFERKPDLSWVWGYEFALAHDGAGVVSGSTTSSNIATGSERLEGRVCDDYH